MVGVNRKANFSFQWFSFFLKNRTKHLLALEKAAEEGFFCLSWWVLRTTFIYTLLCDWLIFFFQFVFVVDFYEWVIDQDR